ncbi:MAG: hypothetical protein IJG80_01600 [Selenomonadaceae bacterium]|nr:hypothetical protein [Selenomonadaceae bacterium]MBQ3726443.1 hypothetical protein [Selenomonadaceae bacterium]MBQ9496746.1 hypothetical protein [Selenomonadaceae bacterium]
MQLKLAAKILAVMTVMILVAGTVEAAPKFITPPRLRQPFVPPLRPAPKEYFPRQPFRPKPHYTPHVPRPTWDNRGGKRKNFGPPPVPHR